jgi:hypothetical protein
VAYAITKLEHKALVFSMPEQSWQRVLRDLVILSRPYGLIIIDEEIATAFLPNDSILPIGAEQAWSDLLLKLAEEDKQKLAYSEANLPNTEEAYQEWVRPLLDEDLGKYGFKRVLSPRTGIDVPEHSYYCREVAIGKQYLEFRHAGEAPYFSSGTTFYMICPIVTDIYNLFDFKNTEKVFWCEQQSFTDVTYYCNSALSIELAQEHINDIVSDIIRPILDKITDIKGLDSFVNGWLINQSDDYMMLQNDGMYLLAERKKRNIKYITADEFNVTSSYTPHRLIIARLANNLKYGRLLRFCEASNFLQSGKQANTTEWQKLVKYLNENINPETFWQQYTELKTVLKIEEIYLDENRVQTLKEQFNLNPDEQLIPLSDQWYEPQTNLIWQRCCMGQHKQNGEVIGEKKLFNENEVHILLEQFKNTGWRLPTMHELGSLAFSIKAGYITQNSFMFYETVEKYSGRHWIEPFAQLPSLNICMLVIENNQVVSSLPYDANLKGFVRLVKSVHKQA